MFREVRSKYRPRPHLRPPLLFRLDPERLIIAIRSEQTGGREELIDLREYLHPQGCGCQMVENRVR